MTRALRTFALIVTFVVVQVSVFPHLRILGAVPDLGLLLTLSIAFYEGAEAAAIAGFVAGFGLDLFLQTPIGLSALAYALTGFALGVLQTGVLRSPKWVAPFVGAAGGIVSGLIFVVVGVLAGTGIGFTYHTFALIGAASVYDFLLAPFVFVLTTRLLGHRPEPIGTVWVR
jgi:rod shape-determining protein MreD